MMSDGNTGPNRVDADARTVEETFDGAAPLYDLGGVFRESGQRLVDLLAIAPGANVLDVATGTNIILGVNSFVSNPNCDGVTYSQRIDIADILAWINGFMA